MIKKKRTCTDCTPEDCCRCKDTPKKKKKNKKKPVEKFDKKKWKATYDDIVLW